MQTHAQPQIHKTHFHEKNFSTPPPPLTPPKSRTTNYLVALLLVAAVLHLLLLERTLVHARTGGALFLLLLEHELLLLDGLFGEVFEEALCVVNVAELCVIWLAQFTGALSGAVDKRGVIAVDIPSSLTCDHLLLPEVIVLLLDAVRLACVVLCLFDEVVLGKAEGTK